MKRLSDAKIILLGRDGADSDIQQIGVGIAVIFAGMVDVIRTQRGEKHRRIQQAKIGSNV